MKISQLTIKNFRQFEDLDLNLTYPKGHEKAGQPLDKVCLIGQSGTGKTTLLEIVKRLALGFPPDDITVRLFQSYYPIDFKDKGYAEGKFINSKNQAVHHSLNRKGYAGKGVNNTTNETLSQEEKDKLLKETVTKHLLYFPAGITSIKAFENGVFTSEANKVISDALFELKDELLYFEFNQDNAANLWLNYLKGIYQHQRKEVNFRLALTKRAEKEIVNIKTEMDNWRKTNPNPLKTLAEECLDKFLNKFHLATKTEFDDVDELKTIQIRLLHNHQSIPYQELSTGTRQILYTALPIYYLLKDNSIVLMDEPENSLYPDIQTEIIPYYLSLDKSEGKNTQFFFATHSPIIASSFEPWEVVELKLTATGKVYRELYFEGENHVNNYTIDPRYLRWDSILTKVFDLNEEGNTKFRADKVMEFSLLKRELNDLKKQGKLTNPSAETQDLIKKYKKAGELLNWQR